EDPRRQGAAEIDADRLRDAEPGPAGREGDRDICRSETGRKATQRAVGCAVRVGANDDAAGTDEPFLHHQLVADAFLEDLRDTVLAGQIADQFVEARRGDRVGGKNVV